MYLALFLYEVCFSDFEENKNNLLSKQVVKVQNRNNFQASHDMFMDIFTSRTCRDTKEEQTAGILDVLTLAPEMLSSNTAFGANLKM